MSHAKIARREKSEIAKSLTTYRDRLQTLYDWHTAKLDEEDVTALFQLIQHMSRVLARFKQ